MVASASSSCLNSDFSLSNWSGMYFLRKFWETETFIFSYGLRSTAQYALYTSSCPAERGRYAINCRSFGLSVNGRYGAHTLLKNSHISSGEFIGLNSPVPSPYSSASTDTSHFKPLGSWSRAFRIADICLGSERMSLSRIFFIDWRSPVNCWKSALGRTPATAASATLLLIIYPSVLCLALVPGAV